MTDEGNECDSQDRDVLFCGNAGQCDVGPLERLDMARLRHVRHYHRRLRIVDELLLEVPRSAEIVGFRHASRRGVPTT